MPHSLAAKFSPETRRLADELAIPAAARLLRLINELEDLASSGNADEDDTASYAENLADALVRRSASAVRLVLILPQITVYTLQGDPEDTLRYVQRIKDAGTRVPNTAALFARIDAAVVRTRRGFRLAELRAEVGLLSMELATLREVSCAIDRLGNSRSTLALRHDVLRRRIAEDLDVAQRALTALEQSDDEDLGAH
ncbi:hypothetical protein C8Q80DRAFT_1118515 [Daedaleopsis nitida]|nr:hypothetical protein C8Q80DRAFT_1118515 [Daedaleopsis nitida]